MKLYFKKYYNRPAFLGSVISAGASLIGGALSNKSSSKEAQSSQQHSDYQLQNRHQWEAKDLRKAGRNPILYSGTTPSAGSSAMAAQHNIAQGLSSGIDTESQRTDSKTKKGKLSLEEKLATSQIKLLGSQSAAAQATANNQNAQAGLTGVETIQRSRLTPIYKGVGEVTSSAKKTYDQLKGPNAWYKNLPKFGRGLKNSAKSKLNKWRN